MSLINKMLQDLEERRSEDRSGEGFQAQIRVVPERVQSRLPWIIAACAALLFVAVGAWFWGRLTAPVAAPSLQISPQPQLALKLAPQLNSAPSVAVKETEAEKGGAEAAPIAPDSAKLVLSQKTQSDVAAASPSAVHPASASKPELGTAADAVLMPPLRKSAVPSLPPKQVAMADAASMSVNGPGAPEKKQIALAKEKSIQVAITKTKPSLNLDSAADKPNEIEPDLHLVKQIKELTPQQRAENEYRRAVLLIQQQRSAEATGVLEQALQLDAEHVLARETLVGLLIDAKRNNDAIRKLEEGLLADRTQSGLAMMLARLQVEKKELKPAIETLQRTLPYAGDRADYQAFIAALLQRDGHHKDAIEHYLIALRKSPQNGLWWMGLAISLQADNRMADAREAFNRAKTSNMLSADLLVFVDQRLAQLR